MGFSTAQRTEGGGSDEHSVRKTTLYISEGGREREKERKREREKERKREREKERKREREKERKREREKERKREREREGGGMSISEQSPQVAPSREGTIFASEPHMVPGKCIFLSP